MFTRNSGRATAARAAPGSCQHFRAACTPSGKHQKISDRQRSQDHRDGFLILMDRKNDMIISGGFNIYPSDLETVLCKHEAVLEAAVVGVPSDKWGETPVAFVVLKPGRVARAADILRDWVNGQVGKTQRLAAVEIVPALPRSTIGKVLKRELRHRYDGHSRR